MSEVRKLKIKDWEAKYKHYKKELAALEKKQKESKKPCKVVVTLKGTTAEKIIADLIRFNTTARKYMLKALRHNVTGYRVSGKRNVSPGSKYKRNKRDGAAG